MDITNQLVTLDPASVAQALKKKCKYHPAQSCDLIHLSGTTKDQRICYICADEQNIPDSHVLDISTLLSAGPLTFLPTFPILLDEKAAEKVQAMNEFMHSIQDKIEVFYKELLLSIQTQIQKQMEETQQKASLLVKSYNSTITTFYQEIEILQKIIIANNNDNNSLDNDLTEFIRNACNNANTNNDCFQANYQVYEALSQQFSLESANKVQKSIMDLVDQQKLISVSDKQCKINILNNCNFFPLLHSLPSSQQSLLPCISIVPEFDDSRGNNATIVREDSGSFLITHNGTIEEKNLSCYIDSKLDKHTNYIIRVQMLHHANFSMPWFFFVLLPKDPQTNTICDSKVTYNEMFSGSVNRIIKGKKLCSGQTNIGTSKLLELRINLSKQYLKIADYPQFENIVSLDDPNKIQDNYDYYFKIAIGITSNSVRLLDILTVKEFDERMD